MIFRHRMLLVCLILAGAEAGAANPRATDAAFAALLSMPTAKPSEGTWNIPPAEGFAAKSEAGLMAYLSRQKKAGADFNAYRHQGTLLHHAIRAQLPKTAVWLLENGASPRLRLRDASTDSLELSITYKLEPVATLLQKKYGLVLAVAPPAPSFVPPAPTPAEEAASIASRVAGEAQTAARIAKALADIPQDKLHKYSGEILKQMQFASGLTVDANSGKMAYSIPAESWRTLWRHLEQPLDYGEAAGLARNIQPELWRELVASGYPGKAEDALACLLAETSASQLRALWPQLIAQFSDLHALAPRMVLSAHRIGTGSSCDESNIPEIPAKLAFLSSLGIRTPVAGIDIEAIGDMPPKVAEAIKPFIKSQVAAKPRLVSAKPACTFTMSDAWYQALTSKKGWAVDTVQLLEVPGETECAVLVGGDENTYFPVRETSDSFDGPFRDPIPSCPDPTDVYQVWRRVGGKIVVDEPSLGHDRTLDPLIHVRDTVTGKTYYLNSGEQPMRCHLRDRFPFAFEWRGGRLVRSYPSEVENTLFEQCKATSDGLACAGIAELSPAHDWYSENPSLFSGASMESLLRDKKAPQPTSEVLKKKESDAYVAAVMALDKAQMKSLRAGKIAPGATAAAIVAVSKSELPLAEKRKRIAWLFYDHAQLEKAFDSEWPQMLLDWLPYEDWRPVMKAIANFGPTGSARADELRAAAAQLGMERLACDIDNARGWICGETISDERKDQ